MLFSRGAAPLHTDDSILHWLALRMTPGLGTRRAMELLERYGSPEQILRLDPGELEAAGVAPAVASSMAAGCAYTPAAEVAERNKQMGVETIPWPDPRYPARLREIFDPPLVLFALGRVELLNTVMVAIVGSRRPTAYGLAVAERFGKDLAASGVTVVSGMAKGIDTAAHQGALAARGATVAVFGCGLDVIYPAENRALAERIAKEGLLLSEFPVGTPGHAQNFPIRNRVISGLSEGVVVVEGKQYSGSLITARLALDQNREVFAVPGNITSPESFGPNLLIRQGAQLVQSHEDVLDGLGVEARARLARQAVLPVAPPGAPEAGPMSHLAEQILHFLPVDRPMPLDELIDAIPQASPSELIAVLFELEEAGRVRQLPGKSYVKVWSE
jgi:DNA processing protein